MQHIFLLFGYKNIRSHNLEIIRGQPNRNGSPDYNDGGEQS